MIGLSTAFYIVAVILAFLAALPLSPTEPYSIKILALSAAFGWAAHLAP